MKKKRRGVVDIQNITEIQGSTKSYENYVERNDKGDENVRANPDILPEQDASPSSPQLILGEAVTHLQGRQKAVYLLVMRDDHSIAEAGEALEISKGSAQVYLDRAIRFIKGYCEEAIKAGRV